jgi:hypothetical protein
MRRLALASMVAAIVTRSANADGPQTVTLRALFPKEAEVTIEKPGVSRLPLPPEVLSACRPDLSDLRLLDSSGNEMAFLLDGGVDPNAKVKVVESAGAMVVDVNRKELRREEGPTIYREEYQLAVPEVPSGAGQWQIVVKTARPRFVRRLNVSVVEGDGALTSLVENASLFRLPELPDASKEHVSFPLPAFSGSRLAVAIEGEDDAYLAPAFELTASRAIETARPLVVPLEEVGRHAAEGRTVIELSRPPGLVPDLLKVETTTPWFQRPVVVRDRVHDNDGALLGSTEVFRFRDVPGVESLEVPLSRAGGERLSVEISDGDSPPLEGLAFSAIVRQPALIFFAAEAREGTAAAFLLFGGGRAGRPRYDLSGRLPAPGERLRGSDAAMAAYLHDASHVALAHLGDVRANAMFDESPALAFAMRPGVAVDRRLYTHRRELAVAPSPDGVARLRLSAEEASVARDDLADVRVVDASGRQWPYLIGALPAAEERDIPVEREANAERTSRYHLRLPASPIRIEMLTLETDEGFVDRPFRIIATHSLDAETKEQIATSGRLIRRSRDRLPIKISLSGERIESLELVIEDGNEAPLRFTSVRARIRVPEVLITVPAGDYALLLGNARDERPRYDLEAVREVVSTVTSAAVAPGMLRKNPDYSARAGLSLRAGLDTLFFWIVLGAAVVVLGSITLRLARSTPPTNG